MRAWTIAVLMLGLAVGAVAQEPSPDPRRAELEQQVRRQFLSRVAQRLELTDDQRDRLVETMREGAESRQELARESRTLRHDLMQAVRSGSTEMETFQDILGRLDGIRDRERAIQEREEARLAEFLDPRQRAIFLVLRMQFNDRIRGMRGPGPHRGGPGGAGPPL
jgi:Spy/CpxP family protein refolding chaperone